MTDVANKELRWTLPPSSVNQVMSLWGQPLPKGVHSIRWYSDQSDKSVTVMWVASGGNHSFDMDDPYKDENLQALFAAMRLSC